MDVKINKMPLAFFKGDLAKTQKQFEVILYLFAATSVVMNVANDFVMGLKALLIVLVSVFIARETEIFFLSHKEKITRQEAKVITKTTKPEITGLIFALLLPVGTPLFIVLVGAFISIFIGKMVFGGYSYNVFNPALVGRLFVAIAWPALVTIGLGETLDNYILEWLFNKDLSGEFLTPLMELQANGVVSLENLDSIFDLLFTVNYGMMYTLPAIAYILIIIYFSFNKLVDLFPLVVTLITSTITIGVIAISFKLGYEYVLYHLLAGGFLFVTIFMMTDPFTKPFTKYGTVIYAVIFTVVFTLIRFIGVAADGVLYALLFANLFVPLLNKKTLKSKFKLSFTNLVTAVLLVAVLIGTGMFINTILEERIANEEIRVGELYEK